MIRLRILNDRPELFPGFSHRSLAQVKTLPAEVSNSETVKSTSGQDNLERSRTDRHKPQNILAKEAAEIFSDKIPVQQKVSLTSWCCYHY